MFKKNQYKRRMRRESRREAFEKDGFQLAYGITIILLGGLSLYFDTPKSVLLGVSMSALLFTIVNTLSPRKSYFHFFTISVLLVFCIFPNMKYFEPLLEDKIYHSILFFSFGLIFLISSISTYKNILNNKRKTYEYLNDISSMVVNQFEHDISLLKELSKIKDSNRIESIDKVISNTQDYIQNEYIVCKTKYDLALKGQEEVKSSFSLNEIEASLQKTMIPEKEETTPIKKEPKKKENKKTKVKS